MSRARVGQPRRNMKILAAFDKFRGTMTGQEACDAACRGALDHSCVTQPIADGGEGTLEAFGGPNRWTEVTGPLGASVRAGWRFDDDLAVIEMAVASGLALVVGSPNALDATTRGTGELIAAAIEEGAGSILVGVGGSATTDGGWGAVEALGSQPFRIPVTVACDVETPFLDAAATFAPQKGASPADVAILSERLAVLADQYELDFGVAVATMPRAGAAGGLAGGLAVLGAKLSPGFDVVSDRLGLARLVDQADLVLTGEGAFDATSLRGKAVGGMLALAMQANTQTFVIAGRIEPGTLRSTKHVSLVDRYGEEAALTTTAQCLTDTVSDLVGRY